MVSYKELFNFDESIRQPILDAESERLYRHTKEKYLFKNVAKKGTSSVKNTEINQDLIKKEDNGIYASNNDTEENTGNKEVRHELYRIIAGAHQGWVRSCVVDPVTNKWFATGSSDATIKVWNLASSEQKAIITGHIMGVRALAVSSRYPYLFSGSEDKTVRCWDLERTNSPLGSQIRNYHGHVGGVYALALHPELDLLFSGGRDSGIRVWDIRTRTEAMVLLGHRDDITSIVSETGDPQVISSSMDGSIRLWDLRKASTELTLTHHTKSIRLLVMHPSEMTMCSGDSAGNLKEWVLPKGHLLSEFGHLALGNIINTLAINSDANTLFTGYDDGRIDIYDYVSGELLQSTKTQPVAGSVESTIYASSYDMLGLRLITCEGDKSVKIWKVT